VWAFTRGDPAHLPFAVAWFDVRDVERLVHLQHLISRLNP
jgi:hypothetical protein